MSADVSWSSYSMKEKSLDNLVTKKCIHNEGLNAPYETILGYGSCANAWSIHFKHKPIMYGHTDLGLFIISNLCSVHNLL